MKNQINQRRQTVLLATIATIFIFSAFGSTFAQGRLGKKYGTRGPRPCTNAEKTGRTISAAEAVASVICNAEHEIGNESLFLVEDVKVTFIGKGYRPNPNAVSYPTMPDLDSLEYPIRGSYKKYQCGVPDLSPPGKNCRLYNEANAKGECYKDTFGQWHCGMTDEAVSFNDYEEVAPPGGAVNQTTDGLTAKKPAANNQPKTGGQMAEKKTEVVVERDENGFPKPDFFALEKWYQIIRYEYKPIEKKLYIYFKTDVAFRERPDVFKMEFRNKDGMLMLDTALSWIGELSNAEVGEPTKGHVNMPSEKTMQDVTSVKAVRVIE